VTTELRFTLHSNHGQAEAFIRRDQKAVSPSYTRAYGFVIDHGKGAEVWDVDGNKYLDFAAGIAVLATGHCHPKVVEAVKKQVDKYLHIGATDFFCPKQIALAEKLQSIMSIHGADKPEDIMIYFGNSGTEAVEAALKLARYQDEKRKHIIGFFGGFHGRTIGALSVTASKAIQRADYPHIPGGVSHIPYPGKWISQFEGTAPYYYDPIEYIEYFIIDKKVPADEIAAVLVEPIQGEGGYVIPKDDFLPSLREFCDRHGILLIADEIQSGVGRTGKWYAMEHWDTKADIVTTAKGLGSGVPIGAIAAHKDVMGQWIPGAHASTFGGNPVAAAAAIATIEVIEEEGLLEHATKLGEYTINRLSEFQKNHPSILRVEGKGLMVGVEFANDDRKPFPAFRNAVEQRMFTNNVLMLGCGKSGMRIAPPLIISQEQMEQGLDILERVIADLEEEMWDA